MLLVILLVALAVLCLLLGIAENNYAQRSKYRRSQRRIATSQRKTRFSDPRY